jgi:hypothetical protein
MSGLIFAGIGKGIADAGQTFAQAGMRQYEMDRQDEREGLREERLLKRQEALDELKAAREETKLRKDADIYAQAETNAPAIGEQRRFGKFKTDVGQTDASEEELRKVFDEQYNQRKVGNFEGADRYAERYSKQKEDVLNEIRRMGGSSTAIKEGRESYKATVDAETRADKEVLDRRREDRRDVQAQQTAEYQTGMVAAAMRRADASVISAEKPRGGGADGSAKVRSTYTDDQGNKIAVMSDGSTKTLGRGMDFDKQVSSLVNTMSKNDYNFGKLPEAEKRQKAIERLTGGAPAPKTSDNAGTRPPLSSFNR